MDPIVLAPARRLAGTAALAGDKSVSHRALIVSSLAHGRSGIENLGDGEAVRRTAACLRGLGASISLEGDRAEVEGKGPEGLREAKGALDAGASATTLRLLMGVLAGRPFKSTLTGDAALSARPMERVAAPLRLMGARVSVSDKGGAPVTVEGGRLKGIDYKLPAASAQLKSALLLAGVQAEGETTVTEPYPTRDHTEKMLKHFGYAVKQEGRTASIKGGGCLKARDIRIPGDISTASFFIAGACIVEQGDVLVKDVLLNPTRTGFLRVLLKMGAEIDVDFGEGGVEPSGELRARSSELKAIELGPGDIPSMIDELPILAVLATRARGRTVVRGAGELKFKESDRLASLAALFKDMGGRIEVLEDGFAVEGPQRLKGGTVDPSGDHRMAMVAAVAALAAEGSTRLLSPGCVAASCPGFFDELKRLSV